MFDEDNEVDLGVYDAEGEAFPGPEEAYEVPEDQRLDKDSGRDSDARDGGVEDLSDVYENPGEVVELDEDTEE